MDLFEAIRTKRSIRRFQDKPLEGDKLQRLLEAFRQAPSWAKMQCWHLIVVKDPAIKEQISKLSYLDIPSNIRVVGLFPIGCPRDEKKERPPRKPLNETVSYERWEG